MDPYAFRHTSVALSPLALRSFARFPALPLRSGLEAAILLAGTMGNLHVQIQRAIAVPRVRHDPYAIVGIRLSPGGEAIRRAVKGKYANFSAWVSIAAYEFAEEAWIYHSTFTTAERAAVEALAIQLG